MANAQIDMEATPKRFRRVEPSSPTISTCFTYPSRSQTPMCHTPSALTEVPQVGVTAEAGEIAFLWCDHEPAQAHRRVWL
jgi:hypothetical protein